MIAIVDFKAGNLTSVKKAFDHLGAETVITSYPAQVLKAEKLVLPGVGHFAATKALDDSGLRDAIMGTKNWDGVLGQWSFNQNGDTSLTEEGIYQVKNGKFEYIKAVKSS